MRIIYILGTRPEIVKASPVVRAAKELGVELQIVHTGQHYDANMDTVFFKELEIQTPEHHLHVGSQPYRKQVGIMVKDLREILSKERPDVVIVQGDTLTVLTGALAADKENIPIAHLEAGLRSHDLSMPEETNRIITDHISDILFVPGKSAMRNLQEEGIIEKRLYLVGNTVVDAVLQNKSLSREGFLEKFGLEKKGYAIITAHRAENVDNKERLKNILMALALIADDHPGMKLLYPMHPRTKKRVEEYAMSIDPRIMVIEPVGYLEFLALEEHAKVCITDSGGVQEEACILQVPCVTIRDNTERPETVEGGMNIVAGNTPEGIRKATSEMLTKEITWTNPYGDGTTGKMIINILKEMYG